VKGQLDTFVSDINDFAQKAKALVLEKIINTLIALPEDKLAMIYQVIQIITNLNGGGTTDITTILDLENNTHASERKRRFDDLSSLRKSNNSNDSNTILPRSVNSFDSPNGKHFCIYIDKNFVMLKKRHREDKEKKAIHVRKNYEMSDKHSLVSDKYLNDNSCADILYASQNNINVQQPKKAANNNITITQNCVPNIKPKYPASNSSSKILLDYNEMSSNSDIDPLLVTSDMDKRKYVKINNKHFTRNSIHNNISNANLSNVSSYSQQSPEGQLIFQYPIINEHNNIVPTKSSFSGHNNTYNQLIKPQIQTTQHINPNYYIYDMPTGGSYCYSSEGNFTPNNPYITFKQPNTNKYTNNNLTNLQPPITEKLYFKFNKK
jgi:hypothetical protein